jgi:hypothetical protein
MFVITCRRDSLIEIGAHFKVRVLSINQESVELEIDTPGDTCLEPDATSFEQSQRNSSLEYMEVARLR